MARADPAAPAKDIAMTTNPAFRPRRSVLYMPGTNPRALEKAKTLPADCLILDLEDAVAPEAKVEARERIAAAVTEGGYGSREVVIRINGLDTEWGRDDLAAAAKAAPDAILVPKISTDGDVAKAGETLLAFGAPEQVRLWIMMETPRAMLNAASIAAAANAATRLACMVMGTNDLAKETGALLSGGRIGMVSWLSGCVAAARAYGLDIIDGVYNDFKDEAGFEGECAQGRALGMDGKTLIHPGQIGKANEVFSPSADDVAWSRTIIAAFELPENAGKGVITVEGRMVEMLHAEIARRVVAIADAVG